MMHRQRVLEDTSRHGAEFARVLSDATDAWLTDLLTAAVGTQPIGLALAAVGGYGRGELCPGSDLDVLLVHDGRHQIGAIAEQIWYPIWDAKAKLGHTVGTVKEVLRLATENLDTATALLSCRFIAGDRVLADEIAEKSRSAWRKRGKKVVLDLDKRVAERHALDDDVAFLLEPDLKEGRGGLRDVHALDWAEATGLVDLPGDPAGLRDSYEVLLSARVALHRTTGRPNDVLLLEEQDAVAADLGYDSADTLMAAVASAARTIAWTSDETWHLLRTTVSGPPDRGVAPLSGGIWWRDGEIHLDDLANPAKDPTLLLRVAAAAARRGARIHANTLDRLVEEAPPMPDPWPVGAVDELVALLMAGPPMIDVIESIDHRGLVTRFLPEWEAVRAKPQRNAFHRFTVDRHLLECCANAAGLASRVSRPDLLMLGALFHDIGKGYPGDHTDVGVAMMAELGPRLGLGTFETDVVTALVRQHLLLPDVATRRDINDDATITMVADAAGSPLVLELLAVLTEADSLATGPSAWSGWKAELVEALAERAAHVLGGGAVNTLAWELFPSAEVEARMGAGVMSVTASGHTLTAVVPDRPGLFSKLAGVLALHGLDVAGARAHSDEQGMAANEFRVLLPRGKSVDWTRVLTDAELALSGRLAIDARLAERAKTYGRRRTKEVHPITPSLTADNNASSDATVLEVRARDAVGVLYRITRALADMQVDIRHAKVSSLEGGVVDAFYVRDSGGAKITEPAHLAELERAVLHALAAG